mmetsp:Transcript_977/g.2974  ORF Transcript_977/g.2974 Transcript_977/m.2974 type:complete len:201 (-) Transcript_977:3601-4203(-)
MGSVSIARMCFPSPVLSVARCAAAAASAGAGGRETYRGGGCDTTSAAVSFPNITARAASTTDELSLASMEAADTLEATLASLLRQDKRAGPSVAAWRTLCSGFGSGDMPLPRTLLVSAFIAAWAPSSRSQAAAEAADVRWRSRVRRSRSMSAATTASSLWSAPSCNTAASRGSTPEVGALRFVAGSTALGAPWRLAGLGG